MDFTVTLDSPFWPSTLDARPSTLSISMIRLVALAVTLSHAALAPCAAAAAVPASAPAAASPAREEVLQALRRAVEFFRSEVSVHGTYLWQYSEDLQTREGEVKATATQGWVQPPGTPSVGAAFLSAWQATSNWYFLEAARETAHGLVRGQLESGGWHYAIDFNPEI